MRGRRRTLCAAAAVVAAPWLIGAAAKSARAQQRVESRPQDRPATTPATPHGDTSQLPQTLDRQALGPIPDAPQAPQALPFWSAPRTLWLTRRDAPGLGHATIRTVWWRDGAVVAPAYEALSLFLGDPGMNRRIVALQRQGRPVPAGWHHAVWFSPAVLDILYALTAWLEVFDMARPIEVTSAFRHPRTNAALEGAARNSLHQVGAAVDVVVPGVPASAVARFAAWMRGGGVGVYPDRGFTHLDAGPVRRWRGG